MTAPHPLPLSRDQIEKAIENYRYACELMDSDERVDQALGEDIMNRMDYWEFMIVLFEINLHDECDGDFRNYMNHPHQSRFDRKDKDWQDMIRLQYPEHWPTLQTILTFQ